jgi:SAM-dependent methyltransferase
MTRPREKTMQGFTQHPYHDGYWRKGTRRPGEACETLLEQPLALIPEKHDRILDVTCGLGATTRDPLQYDHASEVVGIKISARQLACADRGVESILCVESACHFDTRAQVVAEAYRVLKPGGSVVLSDVLLRRVPGRWQQYIPQANVIDDRGVPGGLPASGFPAGGHGRGDAALLERISPPSAAVALPAMLGPGDRGTRSVSECPMAAAPDGHPEA